ncbi:hypothetical protein [Nocardia sp. Marseille-Q1738]
MSGFDELPELTPEQRADMSESERGAYEQLREMGPAERARFLGHARIAKAADTFLDSVCKEGNLKAVWSIVDPPLRLAMAQRWILDNAAQFDADGYDRDTVAAALAEENPDHPLWTHFERVHVRSIKAAIPAVRGTGTNTRLLAPDVELLHIHDQAGREGSAWQPGEVRHIFPIAMRFDGDEWRVASLGTESLPVPGWPPSH